jgi:hypothetical protein
MNCPVVHDFDPLAPLDPEAARILLAGGHKPQLALEALTRRFSGMRLVPGRKLTLPPEHLVPRPAGALRHDTRLTSGH